MRRLGLVVLLLASIMGVTSTVPAHAAVSATVSVPYSAELNSPTRLVARLYSDDYGYEQAEVRIEDQYGNTLLTTGIWNRGYNDDEDSVATIDFTFREEGNYCLAVHNYYSGSEVLARECFAVTDTAPRVTRLDGAAPFYPVVKDRFKDTTKLTYAVNQNTTVSYHVFSGSTEVRSADLGVARASAVRTFTWDGKNNRGKVVKPGRYRVQVQVDDGNYVATRAVRTQVVTDVVTARKRMSKVGWQTARRLRSGDCYFYDYEYSDDLDINCMGYSRRATADVRWTFRAPTPTATILRWNIGGEIRCCAQGVFRKSASMAAGQAVLRLQMSGLRAFTAEYISVVFAYQRRR